MTEADRGTATPAVFLSHASADLNVARQITDALEALDMPVWFAVDDIAMGENYAEQIYRNLRRSQAVVVLVSSAATRSAHVRRELSAAIDLGIPLLPFSLQAGLIDDELPLDWRYWLGIVQVHAFTDPGSAARLVQEQVRPKTRPVGRSTPRRSADERSAEQERTEVRAVLIRVAVEHGTLATVLDRCRRIKIEPATVVRLAEEFRASGLIRFDGAPGPTTSLTLAT